MINVSAWPRGARVSTLIQMWREIEGESSMGVNSVGTFRSDGQESGNDNNGVEDEFQVLENENHSMDLGQKERQRIRQVFQECTSEGVKIQSLNTLPINGQSKVECVKEGVEMKNEPRGTNNSHRDEGRAENSPQIQEMSDRPLRGLRGGQAILDFLLKAQGEQQRELQSLMESRPVSDFAYRNRIQSLLRGRFLRNDRLIWDERPASVAASEIGLLRQRQAVSYLRERFLSRLVHIEPSHGHICGIQSNDSSNGKHNALENVRSKSDIGLEVIDDFHEQFELGTTVKAAETSERSLECEGYGQEEVLVEWVTEQERTDSQQFLSLEFSELGEGALAEHTSGSWLESAANLRDPTTPDNDVEEHSHVQGSNNEELRSSEATTLKKNKELSKMLDEALAKKQANENGRLTDSEKDSDIQWEPTTPDNDVEEHSHVQGSDNEESMDVPSTWNAAPVGRVDSFYIPDDSNGHSVELQELLSRRRVSNLLQSGFRERLDLVVQSYVERQEQAYLDWEMDGTTPSPSANGDLNDIERNNFPLTSSPDSLSQPLWDQDLLDSNMVCYSHHPRPGTEWEIINELRTDMDSLQQQMSNMQRMLEICMEKIELQTSVQHEVFAALNQYAVSNGEKDNLLKDESKWDNVRKGICCLCCKKSTDSLLYRYGHMCTCSECAEKLVQEHGKCPMCQEPVA